MTALTTAAAQAALTQAQREIEAVLNRLQSTLGPGWVVNLDIGWMNVSTWDVPAARIPHVSLTARLRAEASS